MTVLFIQGVWISHTHFLILSSFSYYDQAGNKEPGL
jgi:hypothetical protein